MPIELDITNPRTVTTHIKGMMATPGYHILLQYLNLDRENIIEEGKKARKEEKMIKMWARLEGFDQVIKRITHLANLPVEEATEEPSEE